MNDFYSVPRRIVRAVANIMASVGVFVTLGAPSWWVIFVVTPVTITAIEWAYLGGIDWVGLFGSRPKRNIP